MNQTPDELARKIRDARARQAKDNPPPKATESSASDNASAGEAMRAATDLVAALIVGGFLGYWIDQWLGTKPWAMIILFFLGFAAGFLNIYRAQMGQTYKIGFKETKPETPEDATTPEDPAGKKTPANPAGKKEE